MNIESSLQTIAVKAIEQLYKTNIDSVEIQPTRTDLRVILLLLSFHC